jgi:hypothetical protein
MRIDSSGPIGDASGGPGMRMISSTGCTSASSASTEPTNCAMILGGLLSKAEREQVAQAEDSNETRLHKVFRQACEWIATVYI